MKKCIIILTSLVLAGCLCAVIVLGVRDMQKNIAAASIVQETKDYESSIDAYRTARQQLRSMQKAQLNDVAHDAQADPELAAMAQRQLLNLYTREEQELNLEGMLEMRGYQNPVVIVQQDSVNVLIQTELITQQDGSLILDMVCHETGVESGNVKIIPIN